MYRKIFQLQLYLTLSIMLTALFSDPSLAYFSIENEKRPVKVISSNPANNYSYDSHSLLVSDNYEYHDRFNSNIADWPQVAKQRFFSMDLPLTEIVTHHRGMFVPSEFSVENLIYANLKIAQLVDEYHSMKKRSAEVMKILDKSLHALDHTRSNVSERDSNPIEHNIEKLNFHFKAISGSDINRAAIERSGEDSDYETDQGYRVALKNNEETYSFKYSSGSSFLKGQSHNQQGGLAGDFAKDPNNSSNGRDFDAIDDGGTSRFGQIAQAVLGYVVDNKIEVIFYLFAIFGLFCLLTGSDSD